MKTDPRVDAYIAVAPDFARPILQHLRGLVHRGCPEAQETIKWRFPAFTLNGKLLCLMMAFKAHCRFHFWKGETIVRDLGAAADGPDAFGHLTSLADLPGDAAIRRLLAEAIRLNQAEPSRPPKKRATAATASAAPARKADLPLPADFSMQLRAHPKAAATFEKLPPGQRREYLEWITGAKREETREKRLATSIEWLAEGKTLRWKYQPARG